MSDHIRQHTTTILGSSLNQYLDTAIYKQLVATLHHTEPTFLSSRLKSSKSLRTSGLTPLQNRNAAYDRMFFIRGVKLWNRLPYDVRQIKNTAKLIAAIKTIQRLYTIQTIPITIIYKNTPM